MNFSKISAILLFALTPWLQAADFGSQEYNWSETAAKDFRDYYTRTLNQKSAVINDYWLHDWLQQRLLALNMRSPRPIGATETFVLKASAINAYAMPGNVIAIYSGLIETTDSEDELVSVLAHEMSHIALDHFTRISQNSENQGFKMVAGIALAIILAQQSADAAEAALLGTLASTAQSRLTFSQNMEMEADQLGQEIIQQTDYDEGAGARFFMKLYAQQGGQANYEYLRSHPLGTTRSAKLANKTSQTEQPPSDVFKVLKAYVNYLNNEQYKPVKMTKPEKRASPDVAFAYWLNTFLGNEQNEGFKALQVLAKEYPGYLPAQFWLLRHAKEQKEADFCSKLSRFETALEDRTVTLDVLNVLADGANECGDSSSFQWQAQRLWQSGREEEAIAYLNQQLTKSVDTNQAARLNSLLETYKRRYDRFR